jgi:hypothetical protein
MSTSTTLIQYSNRSLCQNNKKRERNKGHPNINDRDKNYLYLEMRWFYTDKNLKLHKKVTTAEQIMHINANATYTLACGSYNVNLKEV